MVETMPISRNEFDPVAIAVDWLDAAQLGDLDGLLDLYDERATLECNTEGVTLTGREALWAYWAPKLDSPSEDAFAIDDMVLISDGVQVDYQSGEGKPVRIHFRFTPSGKIEYTRCSSLGLKRAA
jgi:hypothetical protein